jgi:hypothetical protein
MIGIQLGSVAPLSVSHTRRSSIRRRRSDRFDTHHHQQQQQYTSIHPTTATMVGSNGFTTTTLFHQKINRNNEQYPPPPPPKPPQQRSAGMYSNLFHLDDDTDDDYPTTTANSSTLSSSSYWIHETYKFFPILIPFIAYLGYDPIATLFASALELLSNSQNNWVAVDGGSYQAKIIAPAINGVVVPAVSILFANLIGTTISTLRQRQLDIHTCLNMEAGQLRILQQCLLVLSPTSSNTSPSSWDQSMAKDDFSTIPCRRYLTQYTTRLIAECQPSITILVDPEEQWDDSLDTELNAVSMELNRLAMVTTSNDNYKTTSRDLLLSQAYTSCSKLYDERAKRITALKSQFPLLHFGILGALALSICVAFLLETKQDILVFLNAIQLRILWTMLVGTFTALGIVCYDLSHPFQGSYQISNNTVQQLYSIRKTLQASLSRHEHRRPPPP